MAAHKAHAEFLTTQVESAKSNPGLRKVLNKMLEDCKLLLAEKVKRNQGFMWIPRHQKMY